MHRNRSEIWPLPLFRRVESFSCRFFLLLRAVVLLSGMLAGKALAALPAGATSVAPVIEKASPAVVNIATWMTVPEQNPLYQHPFFRRYFSVPVPRAKREARSAGSGVIIDAEQGLIVTNHHVIAEADRIEVTLADGRILPARLLGSDAEVDLAALRIEAKSLVALPLADGDKVRVGDFVVAIGNPFGLGQTVTSGIISALGRSGLGILGYEDFIQTDASINPGNSGGALVSMDGRLLGINSAIVAPAGGNVGIGFAIPAEIVAMVTRQLAQFGQLRRASLGIAFQDLSTELAEAFLVPDARGVLLTEVEATGAAGRAGLRRGDVLTALDGKRVRNGSELRNRMSLMVAGERIAAELWREGRRLEKIVLLETNDAEVSGSTLAGAFAGTRFRDYMEGGEALGVEISRIDPDSEADRAGLRSGDIIVAVNRQRLTNLREFKVMLAQPGRAVLQVRRGMESFYLTLYRD